VRRLVFILLIFSWLGVDLASSITSDRLCIESHATEKVEEIDSRAEEVQWAESRKSVARASRAKAKPWLGLSVFYLPSKKENFAVNQTRTILYRNLLI
jgi:hypothetical protein